ncbi:MAG: 23S rRNA (guanosine(2251)-2'-O)-methyltransferase RlmB [Proteobacteria bacterium]|nr:23S rRNA (guanosine(2251)-2'-O)-methyltransferase RlmB [Pseudomonadota bacterium]
MNRIVGIHAVEQALRAGTGRRLLLRKGQLNDRLAMLENLARELGCPVERIAPDQLPAVGELADQGVALDVAMPGAGTERELEALLETAVEPLFLLLDGITDPRNLGACLRSAAGFGVTGVILPKDRSAPINEAAIKTASGGASLVRTFQVVNLSRTMEKLKQAGVWIVGTVLEDSQPLQAIDLKGPVAIVLGAEDAGLRQNTRKHCDFLARIPMPLQGLSLNVSVATGICLYEVSRQRMAHGSVV